MGPTWERLWLGKLGSRARQVRPGVRLAAIGVWTIFLVVDVLVLIVDEHHVMTGVLLVIAAVLGIAAHGIPLVTQRRHTGSPPTR